MSYEKEGKPVKNTWKIKTMSDRLTMRKTVAPFLFPEIEIMIDDSLSLGESNCHRSQVAGKLLWVTFLGLEKA